MYMHAYYVYVVCSCLHKFYLADVVFHECSSHIDLMTTPGVLPGQFEHIPRCFYTFSPATELHVLNVHLCKKMNYALDCTTMNRISTNIFKLRATKSARQFKCSNYNTLLYQCGQNFFSL